MNWSWRIFHISVHKSRKHKTDYWNHERKIYSNKIRKVMTAEQPHKRRTGKGHATSLCVFCQPVMRRGVALSEKAVVVKTKGQILFRVQPPWFSGRAENWPLTELVRGVAASILVFYFLLKPGSFSERWASIPLFALDGVHYFHHHHARCSIQRSGTVPIQTTASRAFEPSTLRP